jgi:gas vesicle protein
MKMNELKSQLKGLTQEIGDILPDDFVDRMLEGMGLQQRRSAFRGFAAGTGIFLAGVVVGGAAALLLAPKAGLETRSDLEDKLDGLIEKVKGMVSRDTEGEGASASGTSGSSTGGTAGKSERSREDKSATATPNRPNPMHHS